MCHEMSCFVMIRASTARTPPLGSSLPRLSRRQVGAGNLAVVQGSFGWRFRPPDRFDLGVGQVLDSKSLAVPARGMSRCVMKCHEMSCSAAPRPSAPASPKLRAPASCMSFLHRVPFRSCRRRFPGSATLFRAYRMCARARLSRRRAYRAPDCAREPNAGRTPPVRSQHRNALPSLPGIEKAAPEAASSRLPVSYHTFLSVKHPGRATCQSR